MSMPEPLDSAGVPLEGRLGDPATLPRLFAWLSRGDWSGLVRVQSGDAERRVYFVDGRVSTAGSTDPQESLASHLIREGLLSEEDRSRAAGQLRTPDRGWSFGKQLVRAGMLQDKDVSRVERRRVVQLAESVLGLRTGAYACEPGQLAGDAQPQQALEVPRLVAEGVLTLWDANSALEALGGQDAVLDMVAERLPDHEATGAEEAYDYTLLLCDGRRTVREVIGASPLPEAASLRFLAALRLLDIVSSRPTVPVAAAPPPAPPAEAPSPATASASHDDASTGGVAADAAVREPGAPASEPPAGSPKPPPEAPIVPPSRKPAPPPPRAPAPKSAAAPAAPAPARGRGASRTPWVLLIVLVLLAATAFFFWIGWRSLSSPEPPAPVVETPSAGEAAPASSEPPATAPIAPPETTPPATEPLPVPGQP